MLNVGVIGYGYWGPNLVRNFSLVEGARVFGVADRDSQRLRAVETRHPGVEVTSDPQELIANPAVDAIVIATPVSTHYDLALRALIAGKHVFVEKPLTQTSEQGKRLIDEAEKRSLVLHVDHTFVYTGAVRKMRQLVDGGELGDLYYYDSVRVNLGLFQQDVSVIWDLAVHDLAIMDYVFPEKPVAVSTTGVEHVVGNPADIAYLTLFFDSRALAHVHVNWLAPVKVRRTFVGGSKRMIVYDDVEPSEKVKVYDKGITVNGNKESLYEALVSYRMGDMWAPRLETIEALQSEAAHFVRCVAGGERPITDGHAGLRVVRILEAATRSLQERGRSVWLDSKKMVRTA